MGRKPYETFVCSCGERCVMLPPKSAGRLAPITEATYPNGNIEHWYTDAGFGPFYVIIPKDEREHDPRPRHLNHFANCPDAGSFKR